MSRLPKGAIPMSRRRSARRASAFLPVVLLCVACATTGPAPTTSPAPSAVAVATASPVAPPTAALTPTPTVVATASPAAPTAGSAEPPRASLATEGGDPVDGQLGSYTWAGGGSDSPWLPGAPLRVGIGERLTLTLASGVGVADWTARRIPAASGGGPPDGSGAVALGGGAAPMTFDAPAPGRWSVQVAVRFVDGLGSATYYWRLEVD
jgi:hypothetical protein